MHEYTYVGGAVLKVVSGELCNTSCVKVTGMEKQEKESVCSFEGRLGKKTRIQHNNNYCPCHNLILRVTLKCSPPGNSWGYKLYAVCHSEIPSSYTNTSWSWNHSIGIFFVFGSGPWLVHALGWVWNEREWLLNVGWAKSSFCSFYPYCLILHLALRHLILFVV